MDLGRSLGRSYRFTGRKRSGSLDSDDSVVSLSDGGISDDRASDGARSYSRSDAMSDGEVLVRSSPTGRSVFPSSPRDTGNGGRDRSNLACGRNKKMPFSTEEVNEIEQGWAMNHGLKSNMWKTILRIGQEKGIFPPTRSNNSLRYKFRGLVKANSNLKRELLDRYNAMLHRNKRNKSRSKKRKRGRESRGTSVE
jgi:hypothetical protein